MVLGESGMLIRCVKYLLCFVSMMMTALFALSFVSSVDGYVTAILMLMIGVCVDLSKYIFWYYRKEHRAFFSISLILVVFSCFASVAFFVTEERKMIDVNIEKTYQYKSHLKTIQLIELEIEAKRKILDTRLDSKFHKQWDMSEKVVNDLAKLRKDLSLLMSESKSIGLDEARQNISTTAFFLGLSEIVGIEFNFLMTFCYAVLALLLEACSLGVIALSGAVEGATRVDVKDTTEESYFSSVKQGDRDSDRRRKLTTRIIEDIGCGEVKPVLRNIIKDYRIQYAQAKDIFDTLVSIGALKKRGNGYQLASDALNILANQERIGQK